MLEQVQHDGVRRAMIDLSDYETGANYDGDYDADLKDLQQRLYRIQVAHIIDRQASVVMFEGWDAAGKGGIIRRMTAEWDPRFFEVIPIGAPSPEEKAHDFLWRFGQRLPQPKHIAVFDRSWYGRVAVERVEGYASEADWRAAYGEINAFEQALIESGTTLVKLFVHTTQKEQDKRLAARLDNPWKRWKTGAEDYRNRSHRAEYLAAYAEMFERTDTAVAPWTIIDGNDKKAARIAAMTHVAETLEAAVPMVPPPRDPEVVALAHDAFGYEPKD